MIYNNNIIIVVLPMKTIVLLSLIIIVLSSYIIYLKTEKKPKQVKIKEGDYQVVVVINKDLGMEKGKILSQFGHAIDSLHEKLEKYPDLVEAWRNNGSAKITLKGTQDDLNRIYNQVKESGIVYTRIFDAGRTQVRAGSNTVIAVGPATKKELQPITGHLSLY